MLLPVSIACHRRTSILHRMPSRSSCCCRRWGDLECVEFDRGIVLAAAAIFQWDHGMGQKLFELSGVLDELDLRQTSMRGLELTYSSSCARCVALKCNCGALPTLPLRVLSHLTRVMAAQHSTTGALYSQCAHP
eukprot:scaffold295590_cov32-Tisochrysis_lutea.AAC.2